jgi:hypothetical protein
MGFFAWRLIMLLFGAELPLLSVLQALPAYLQLLQSQHGED